MANSYKFIYKLILISFFLVVLKWHTNIDIQIAFFKMPGSVHIQSGTRIIMWCLIWLSFCQVFTFSSFKKKKMDSMVIPQFQIVLETGSWKVLHVQPDSWSHNKIAAKWHGVLPQSFRKHDYCSVIVHICVLEVNRTTIKAASKGLLGHLFFPLLEATTIGLTEKLVYLLRVQISKSSLINLYDMQLRVGIR